MTVAKYLTGNRYEIQSTYRHLYARYYSVRWLQQLPYGDKIGHFLLIGGLSFLLNPSFHCSHGCWRGVPWLKSSVYLSLLISLEEGNQYFIPQRSFDLGDLAANYAGILLCSYLAWQVHHDQSNA